MLIGDGINKYYGTRQALKNIYIQIEPAKITTLIGPSGSGKSTLLKALSLLDPPDSGTIRIDDTKYIFPSRGKRNLPLPWPKLTTVFQQLFLWPHLTIRQNITLPIQQNGGDVSGRVEELLEIFDLVEFTDRFPNQVSLGQRQRAAIVRALALHPKFLLLDEITSALDVEYISALLNHLKLLRDQGTGILLVTHLIGFARQSADQVLFMDKGEVVESGGPEILVAPKSKRLNTFLSLMISAS